ncbi:glycoside hydrolase/deacetylase, partial [Lichtheimia hyalospora FSU 10163]
SSAEPTSTDEPSSTRDILPVSSPDYLPDFEAPDFSTREDIPTGPLTRGEIEYGVDEYPEPWKIPEEGHPEIEAAMKAIDWDHVPKVDRRSADKESGDLKMDDYDVGDDTACWWSATGCVKPKANYLPEDIYMCSDAGDWGLTFDDGPMNPRPEVMDKNDGKDPYAEPYLYDLLANNNQSATLFYVGSNVIQYPEAAKRAFDAGHTLCLHTWSHNAMTTLSDEQVVSELYWSLRAVKEAVGVTSRCWRPPYGDVDDRVRAIAHQMGLRTVLWDRDSQDWKLESMTNKGTIAPEEVDNYFTKWINDASSDEEHGHISLQHELNENTIGMAEKWLPKMQETFKVKPIHECTRMESAYWE